MPNNKKRLTLRGGEGDNRRFTRLSSDLRAELTIVPDPDIDDSFLAKEQLMSSVVSVINVSATGLHFVSLVEYEPDQQVWMSIEIDGGRKAVIRGKIIYRNDITDSPIEAFGYGVQFLKTDLAPTAVAVILDYLQRAVKTADLQAA